LAVIGFLVETKQSLATGKLSGLWCQYINAISFHLFYQCSFKSLVNQL